MEKLFLIGQSRRIGSDGAPFTVPVGYTVDCAVMATTAQEALGKAQIFLKEVCRQEVGWPVGEVLVEIGQDSMKMWWGKYPQFPIKFEAKEAKLIS